MTALPAFLLPSRRWRALACALGAAWGAGAHAATLRVEPGQSIQQVIDGAQSGDVVEVARGHYAANLRIDKPLTLKGIDRPTISGGLQGDTIHVTASDVTIEGLIVRDSGDSLKNQNAGIYLRSPTTSSACGSKRPTTFGSSTTSSRASVNTAVRSAATASSSTTPPARASSATTSASCATRCMSMCRTTPSFAETGCTTAATARTT
jgi:hypothetical protein